jgi:hypothetical protein
MAVERTNLWLLRFDASVRSRSLDLASRSSSALPLRLLSPSQFQHLSFARRRGARLIAIPLASFRRRLHPLNQHHLPLAATFRSLVAQSSVLRGESFLRSRLSCLRSTEQSKSHADRLSAPLGASYRPQSLRPFRGPFRPCTSSSAFVDLFLRKAACSAQRLRRLSLLPTVRLPSALQAARCPVRQVTFRSVRRAEKSQALRFQPQSALRLRIRMAPCQYPHQ